MSFFDHMNKFRIGHSSEEIIGSIGSQRLIVYFQKDSVVRIFIKLCAYGGSMTI
jgi:hypothetical protein